MSILSWVWTSLFFVTSPAPPQRRWGREGKLLSSWTIWGQYCFRTSELHFGDHLGSLLGHLGTLLWAIWGQICFRTSLRFWAAILLKATSPLPHLLWGGAGLVTKNKLVQTFLSDLIYFTSLSNLCPFKCFYIYTNIATGKTDPNY